jgi:hypothetical protein
MSPLVLALLLGASSALPPAITPAAGTYSGAQAVTVKALSSGSVIRCTTDGSTPGLSSPRYYAPLTVSSTATVKCSAWVQGKRASPVASASYTINAVVAGSCAAEPLRASNVHYFCDCRSGADPSCVAGNDANDGLTTGTAKRSYSTAYALLQTMGAGHTVAFCRGGAWAATGGGAAIRNLNCSESNTCDFRDYGSQALARPILNYATASGSAFSMGWYRNYASFTRGYRFLNLDIRNVPGFTWSIQGSVQGMEVCNVNVQDNLDEVAYTLTASTSKRLNFHHNTFTRIGPGAGNRANGFLMACDDCSIDSNVFDYVGAPNAFSHAIYVGANPETCTSGCIDPINGNLHRVQRMAIRGNRFTHTAWNGTHCTGIVIVVHEPHDDLLIENNLIIGEGANPACWGISIGNGLDNPGQWRRLVVRRNQLFDVGNKPLSIENCEDCDVDSNLVVTSQDGNAIVVPASLVSVGVGPNLTNTRSRVRNNTVWYNPTTTGAYGPGGTGITVGKEGTGYVVTNNTVYYGPTTKPNGFKCFNLDLSAGSYTSTAGNACFGNVAQDAGYWAGYSVSANPLFTFPTANPDTANFLPQAGSPLIGAGNATYSAPAIGSIPWSASDTGKARDASPDIGAYER